MRRNGGYDFETLDLEVLQTVKGGDAAGMAVQAALSKVGSPYSWGACGPNQFDCSGLVSNAQIRHVV